MHDFINVNFFIIKPLGKYRSFGVGVVPAQYLNQYLNHMFGTTPLAEHEEKSIGYWRKNNDTHFMVNEFIESQPIVHNNKTYDPTMRIVLLMSHEAGNISVNVIGGCWKVPPCGINDEQATITQRHVTDPEYHETDDGVLIAPDDLAMMKKVVAPVFAQAYKIMLEKSVILD
jgi:hypothetical protein